MGGRLAGRNGQALELKGFRLVLATDHGRHNTGVSHVLHHGEFFALGFFDCMGWRHCMDTFC